MTQTISECPECKRRGKLLEELQAENEKLKGNHIKTHFEAEMEGNLHKMALDDVRKLVGFYELFENKAEWDVTLINGGWLARSQSEAEIISNLEQIKLMLWKLLKQKTRGN